MRILKSVQDVIELTMQMSGERVLAELEQAADAVSAFSKKTRLNTDDRYQVNAALSGLSSRIINHPERVRLTPRPARRGRQPVGYLSF